VRQDSTARRPAPFYQPVRSRWRYLRVCALTVVAAVAGAVLISAPAQAAPPYANCSQVWQELGRPIFPQDPGYNYSLDADRDGVGCEFKPAGVVAKSPPVPRRHAVLSRTYNHYGYPIYGQVRSDTWMLEYFSVWPVPVLVQGASRAVKISKVVRTQVNVTQVESEIGLVWARNTTPVNSGTASSATQVTPRVGVTDASQCAIPRRLRIRTSISVRWSDGRLSTISVLGPLTAKRWCKVT
jgi:hypothetical protein